MDRRALILLAAVVISAEAFISSRDDPFLTVGKFSENMY